MTDKPLPLELRMSFAVVLQHSELIGGNTPVYVLSNEAAGMDVEERVAMLKMLASHISTMLRQVATPRIATPQ